MKETRVSYELAIRLKIIGFDWLVSYYYKPNDKNKFGRYSAWHVNFNTPSRDGRTISCPTLAHAQQWFREVHNISVNVAIDFTAKGKDPLKHWGEVLTGIDCADDSTWHAGEYNFHQSSYDEALETSLKYSTHLINYDANHKC